MSQLAAGCTFLRPIRRPARPYVKLIASQGDLPKGGFTPALFAFFMLAVVGVSAMRSGFSKTVEERGA